jgi:hypothetical protein
LLGETVDMTVPTDKKGLMSKLFGRKVA